MKKNKHSFVVFLFFSSCFSDTNKDVVRREISQPSFKISLSFDKLIKDSITAYEMGKAYWNLYPIKDTISPHPMPIWKVKVTNNDSIDYWFYLDYNFFRFTDTRVHFRGCDSNSIYTPIYEYSKERRCWNRCYWEYPLRDSTIVIHPRQTIDVYYNTQSNCYAEGFAIDTAIYYYDFSEVNRDLKFYNVKLQVVFNGNDIIYQRQIPSDSLLPIEKPKLYH